VSDYSDDFPRRSNFDRFLDRVHSDCVNARGAGELSQEGAARLVSAAFNLNGEAEKLKAEEDAFRLESFAMRAPACPDWFQPVPAGGFRTPQERAEYRHGHWPWHHAALVLAARPGGAK